MSCATCFYWLEVAAGPVAGVVDLAKRPQRVGTCRRFPPVPIVVANTVGAGVAIAEPDHVCGEWSSDQQPPERFGLAELPE